MKKKAACICVILMVLAVAIIMNPVTFPDGLAQYDAATRQKIDNAVSDAVLKQLNSYSPGEFSAEGHIILMTEERNGTLIVYALAAGFNYEFENGSFVVISGFGVIPAVISFSEKPNGKLALLDYTEPADGGGDTMELFPDSLWGFVSYPGCEAAAPTLFSQEKEQAKSYLKSIGREDAAVADYQELEYIEINTLGSFGEDFRRPELEDYPDWLGMREQLENGVRYIYEAEKDKHIGYEIYTFTKKKADGAVVEQYRYKVTGDSIKPLSG